MTETLPPARSRLTSLDALRGFDMFWILGADAVIQALGGFSSFPPLTTIAQQLDHKAWEGFAFYDLIFPLFVFIVGVSVVFSLQGRLTEMGRSATVKRILRRGLLLFLFGIISNGGLTHEWPDVRVAGVLQRIAVAYTVTALLLLFCRTRTLIITTVVLLAGYWALLAFVPIRDFSLESSYLEAHLGTLHPSHAQIEAALEATPNKVSGRYAPGLNVPNHFDFRYLPGRMYDTYWDPEGYLSTFPAIATCLLGAFAGMLLRREKLTESLKVRTLLVAGVGLLAAGWLWHLQFPVIKKLWTSSFVLVAGGWSALLLALFYYIIDVRQWRTWCQPFVWIGMNPITLYLAASLIDFRSAAERLVGGTVKHSLDEYVARGVGDLVVLTVSLGLLVGLACFLYRKKIFLRV